MRDLRGLVGWPGGGFTGGRGGGGTVEGEEAWAVVLLGLGLLLGLFWGCLHLRQKGHGRVRASHAPTQAANHAVWREGGVSSPRWSWPRHSQSGSPRLPLPRHSPLPSWSSCPPSYRSQPFLSTGGQNTVAICGFAVESSRTLDGEGGLLPLLLSWPLVQAWAGAVSMTTMEKNQASTSTSLRNNRQFSCLHLIIGIIAMFSPIYKSGN